LLLQEIEKASAQASKFFKFQDKENKILRILPDRTESIYVTYPSKPDEKVQQYKFMAFEQVNDNGMLRDIMSDPKDGLFQVLWQKT
jgi:hypothetical protein